MLLRLKAQCVRFSTQKIVIDVVFFSMIINVFRVDIAMSISIKTFVDGYMYYKDSGTIFFKVP